MTQEPKNRDKPRIGITIGDTAGIGPEIVLKSVAGTDVGSACIPILVGSHKELLRQALALELPCEFNVLTAESPGPDFSNGAAVVDTGISGAPESWGRVSADAGRAAIAAIETTVRLCLDGKLDAIATAPINKEALHDAGSPYPGHTEMLAALSGSTQSLMCFVAGHLRVAPLTTHLSLSEAIDQVKKDRIVNALLLLDRELRRFGVQSPRIAVAGLNPHAGEHGLFGSEEALEIRPAVVECKTRAGIDVMGPFPADTLFLRAARGEFDAVLALFHDQALIAVKSLAFGDAVNVTLGLPIIRTSVDHGTAFDIAGRGIADPSSMIKAILLAAQLVHAQRNVAGGDRQSPTIGSITQT